MRTAFVHATRPMRRRQRCAVSRAPLLALLAALVLSVVPAVAVHGVQVRSDSGEGSPLGSDTLLRIDREALVRLLEDERRQSKMPGLRTAVRFPDGQIVRAAVGLADKKKKIELDDDIGMPGGSTGKTFVAALTMLLVEDGTLSLDDLASQWLGDAPWFERLPNADTMRVRHLLSHSAGIRDYPSTYRFFFSMIRRNVRDGSARYTPEELIEMVLDREALSPAGEGYSYTDVGYLVLGRLIEAASGRSYFDLLEERVLEPLDLHDVRPVRESVLTDVAMGYTRGSRAIKKDGRQKFDPSSEWTGGGLVTTPTMLVEFFGALVDGRLVRPESLDQMIQGGWRDPKSAELSYSFGLFVEDGGRAFGHAGLWPGYRTHVGHSTESGVTIAVQTNRDGRLDLLSLVRRIAALVDAQTATDTLRRP